MRCESMDSTPRVGGQLAPLLLILALVACEGPRRSSELQAFSEVMIEELREHLEHGRLASADSLLALSGPLEARSPALQYWSAQLSARLGDGESTEKALLAAATSGEDIAHEAHFELALMYSAQGKHDPALSHCRELLAAHPGHEAGLVLGTSSAIELGLFDEAIQLARELPENPLRWSLLGQIHYLRGESEAALPLLQQAHEAAPDRASTGYLLARLQLDREDSPAAIELLRPLAAAEPPYADSRALLIGALEGAGEMEEAASWRERERQQQAVGALREARGRAYDLAQQEKFDEALTILQAAEGEHGEDAGLLNDLAAVLTRLERYEEAEQKFLRALELRPDEASIHGNLAQLYLLMGDEMRAEEQAREFERLDGQ